MDKDELKKHDGRDGRPAYVAYKGKVFDVSASAKWKDGGHMGRHKAGEDLTDFIAMAPHGEDVLKRFQEAGALEPETAVDPIEAQKDRLRVLYRKYHPHPIFMHYPLGCIVFAALMQGLYMVTGADSFGFSGLFAMAFSTLMTFPTIAAGLFSWFINYEMSLTTIFKNKLIFSALSVVIGTACTFVGFAMDEAGSSLLYNALLFSNVPVMYFVAYNGGKITWPS